MDRDWILLSQVHPAKLGVDISASIVSLGLIWHDRTRTGLLIHYAAPVIASLALTRANLEWLREKRLGRYVLTHMPASMQALRLAGDTLTVIGARKRRPALIAVGLALVVAGWSHGLVNANRDHADRSTSAGASRVARNAG